MTRQWPFPTAEPTQTEVTNGQSGGIISGKPAVEGEYNRYEARRGIWDTYTNTFTAQNDHHFTSEGFAVTQVERRAAIMSVTSNMGGANWIFSDSTSHGRVNTEVARVSGEVAEVAPLIVNIRSDVDMELIYVPTF